MNINWKLRGQNKATLIALVAAILTLVYTVMGLIGIVPGISQNEVMEVVGLALNVLVLLGIITDPTTPGIGDSTLANSYTAPGTTETE